MTTATQTILDAAMALPEDERAELTAILAAILVDSVADDAPAAELDVAWLAEARRRLEAVRSGQAVISTEEVELELEEIITAASESRRAV